MFSGSIAFVFILLCEEPQCHRLFTTTPKNTLAVQHLLLLLLLLLLFLLLQQSHLIFFLSLFFILLSLYSYTSSSSQFHHFILLPHSSAPVILPFIHLLSLIIPPSPPPPLLSCLFPVPCSAYSSLPYTLIIEETVQHHSTASTATKAPHPLPMATTSFSIKSILTALRSTAIYSRRHTD